LGQNTQICGSGPLHCEALLHLSPSACAGTATLISVLTAMTAANTGEALSKVLITFPSLDFDASICCFLLSEARRLQSPWLQCFAIKGYKSIGFKRAVAKIHIESARRALPGKR
jgi:hypothetical protein